MQREFHDYIISLQLRASEEDNAVSLVKKSCSTNILLLNLIFSLLFSHTNAVIKLAPTETIPAVLIFGDSIVDTGNNNNLITIGKCNYRPIWE
jgi:hypothetical protein